MNYSKVYLSVGTNLGNRENNISNCIDYLEKISEIKNISKIYETVPYKVQIEQSNFLNLALEINFFESAENLLIEINKIEKELGRVRSSIRNEPREIDIDIIFFGNQIINKKDLVVPHPRFRERLFVLEPLNDIAPNFLDPITNKTINQLLINAQNSSN
ncbi:MAG: 2-amino-4-hydroxy-6-hydroxymethyldihydropteridine diphosphokinase [Chloroflexota bacterium]|jgi:2-amino-4-hydroxy-6-hydroxymethyldihydropteridine diphosphokinase|nr:2-amino-4-hydroxy-6-hydroxymethyldihydropteridine diphosphokinase [Chloroflexota bacterium]MBD32976.1 2-amino-4-hydroxy-6-hydroxymethyldihydropteridine diphosphokinase [Dehalococcoidia bacterium]MQG19535.1 2-amino-4-hydroxy-6-hydroxymethyldihydropteridine diphosphokinase [SAR202 cluster bacterium]MAQ48758.1 2-amino-4-hydroxy-6-hydroxymethyldihydropteridine diphosphokinase [Chloroflexota bacterium]MBS17650.1 2-amino-4-hydroxy-6-hydroxymethyldihydropteridine diphosphokinase [Chloroflexota bact|tara:strand:- start:169 stop:645 length:477 start_codon:yes stop_codon:yes gene_type:complete